MLTHDLIETLESHFRADRGNVIAMNAVAATGALSATSDWEVISRTTHTFSHEVRTSAVTDQKQTGRCWAFAGLNVLRAAAMNSLNLESFELSQSYLMFFDKLEKSNFFIQAMIDTASEPLDGRLVQWLLNDPVPDAGQWDMFVNLVERYGVIPKSHMPESWSSSRSRT
ncbi:MAG: C1 family peptidase, partial [Spirochaetota bacterium]